MVSAAQAYKYPRVRVAALIFLDGQIVVVRHRRDDSSYYLLPGGGVSWGETLEQALIREVAEETGLQIQMGPLLLVSDTIDPNGARHVVNLIFEVVVTERPAKMTSSDSRVEKVELVAISELGRLDFRPPVVKQLLNASSTSRRTQQIYIGSTWMPDCNQEPNDS